MTDPKAALRDWSCKPNPPSNSGSILKRFLICFCVKNAPYVGGFVLIKAFGKHGDALYLNPLFAHFL